MNDGQPLSREVEVSPFSSEYKKFLKKAQQLYSKVGKDGRKSMFFCAEIPDPDICGECSKNPYGCSFSKARRL